MCHNMPLQLQPPRLVYPTIPEALQPSNPMHQKNLTKNTGAITNHSEGSLELGLQRSTPPRCPSPPAVSRSIPMTDATFQCPKETGGPPAIPLVHHAHPVAIRDDLVRGYRRVCSHHGIRSQSMGDSIPTTEDTCLLPTGELRPSAATTILQFYPTASGS